MRVFHLDDLGPGEGLADLGHIIDRDQHPALAGLKRVGEALEIGAGEEARPIIAFRAPVGRVQVE